MYRNSPRINSTWQRSDQLLIHWQTDVKLREQKWHMVATALFSPRFTVTNCTSCTCMWEKHWWSEIFYWTIFFFFLIMSFKCVNLCGMNIFQNLCLWEIRHRLLSRRTRQNLDWRVKQVGPIMFSYVVKKEFTSTVTIMPQICHENQPPLCHFVMLTGAALLECLKRPVFYAIGCLLMFVKLVRSRSSHV